MITQAPQTLHDILDELVVMMAETNAPEASAKATFEDGQVVILHLELINA